MSYRVHFKHFYNGFSPDQFLCMFPFLSDKIVITTEAEAELIIFSVWDENPGSLVTSEDRQAGRFHHMPHIERIPDKCYLFWSGENVLPDMRQTDFAITHTYEDSPNHLRLPFWVMRMRAYGLEAENLSSFQCNTDSVPHRGCNFLYSHPVPFREAFAQEISRYVEVVSPGRSWKNSDEEVPSSAYAKRQFLSNFKFTIAFENSKDDGYTTEKIIDPLLAGSIPIYWGNPRVKECFNEDCFLYYDDFGSAEKIGRHISDLLKNPEMYRALRTAPRFRNGKIPLVAERSYIEEFFNKIFSSITSH